MKVINLFAAPGTGKTTSGQILSGLLSIADYKVEYIPEFAKFATFSKQQSALSDQIYMFAKQENRLHVLKNADLDFIIMDGPLPIALLYQNENYYKFYEPLVLEVFNSYENINFLLNRDPSTPYKATGRTQSEMEAKALDVSLKNLLLKNNVPITIFEVNKKLPYLLFKAVTGKNPPKLS